MNVLNIIGTVDTSSVEEATEQAAEQVNLLKDYLDEALPKALSFGISVVIALVVFAIGSKIIGVVRSRTRKHMDRAGVEAGVISFTDSILKFVLYFVLLVLILGNFGLTASAVAALLASSGLTLGLALQGSLQNLAGGFLILLQKPFVVGDYIYEDTHGNEGYVEKITVIYTTLRTLDNRMVIIPNGVLANTSLCNYTMEGTRFLMVNVGIAYSADISRAKELMLEAAHESPYIIEEKGAEAYVNDLSSSSVDLTVRFWVDSDVYLAAKHAIFEGIKDKFDKEGVEIPFPQVTVSYLKNGEN
ncbi:MAG: mechanosensitive ion channel family protein [Eubacterium sp.]|nr:mechanosensitive ion channel family protein [Eubacterium sp.]